MLLLRDGGDTPRVLCARCRCPGRSSLHLRCRALHRDHKAVMSTSERAAVVRDGASHIQGPELSVGSGQGTRLAANAL